MRSPGSSTPPINSSPWFAGPIRRPYQAPSGAFGLLIVTRPRWLEAFLTIRQKVRKGGQLSYAVPKRARMPGSCCSQKSEKMRPIAATHKLGTWAPSTSTAGGSDRCGANPG